MAFPSMSMFNYVILASYEETIAVQIINIIDTGSMKIREK